MLNMCLLSIQMPKILYDIYRDIYLHNYIDNPIIYANNVSYYVNQHIPVLHTKFIFNRKYDYIITDEYSIAELGNILKTRSENLLVYSRDFDSLESIRKKIG